MTKQEGYLIKVMDDAFTPADLMEATHRLVETDIETDDGLPVWEMRDLDGFFVQNLIYLDGDDDE